MALNFDLAISTRAIQEELKAMESSQDPEASPAGAVDAERITGVLRR